MASVCRAKRDGGQDNLNGLNYAETQEYIASLAPRGWRLGLDRMQEFAHRAGLEGSLGDGDSPKYIHVAGTNGKGSVTAMVQSCLAAQGFRTGAFFSPYVVEPRERVQFGRDYISEQELADVATYLMPIGESLSETEFGGVTEFEFKTAIGFEFYKRKQCEWVALEVGLGGRLDATNIITPASSAIVSISYDHLSILGSTLREIAHEKAGIIKPGLPVVVGHLPSEALTEIGRVAEENNAPMWRLGREVLWHSEGHRVRIQTPKSEIEVEPALFGEIQLHNAAVAYAALDAAGAAKNTEQIKTGFKTASLPGRFQRMHIEGQSYILDGAHNEDSAKALAKMLTEANIRPRLCITGMLNGHEPADFYGHLQEFVDEFLVVPIDFHRSMDPKDLASQMTGLGLNARPFETVRAAIDAARVDEETEVVLVCGSFYLVGEIMRLAQSR